MYLAERESLGRRATMVAAGKRLTEFDALLEQAGTYGYRRAMAAADVAVNEVLGMLHFNASLTPVLGHASGRVLATRRR